MKLALVFDEMLLSKEASFIDLFYQEGDTVILIYTIYLKANFTGQKYNS